MFFRPVLILGLDDIVHLERQIRVVQAVGCQIRLGGLVGHVVCEVQVGHGGEIVLHQRRIEDGVVGIIPVLLGVGPVAVLLIGDFVVRRTGDGDRRGVVKDRDLILVDEVAELHVVAVHGVRGHQIDLAVADGDVALLIQGAVAAQKDLEILGGSGDMDGADRVLQTVLGVILHVVDDEGHAEALKPGQKVFHLLGVHREVRVLVIDPVLVPGEGEAPVLQLPGEGRNGAGGDVQDNFLGCGDLLLDLLIAGDAEGQSTGRHQNNQ